MLYIQINRNVIRISKQLLVTMLHIKLAYVGVRT